MSPPSRRPPIPVAFMPPDWSPKSTVPHSPAPPAPLASTDIPHSPPAELFETNPPASPDSPRFPGSSIRSAVPPPSEVFASPAAPPTELTDVSNQSMNAKSIRTSLRELKARQAAIRRAKIGHPSTISTAPPVDVFVCPATPTVPQADSTATTPAFLSSAKGTLRKLKERQAARRLEQERERRAIEDIARIFAEQHKAAMVRICTFETRIYEERWAQLSKRAKCNLNPEHSRNAKLRFCQVPWPLLTPIVHSPAEVNARDIERFLLSPFRKVHLTRREKLDEELAHWEKGFFEASVLTLVQETQRDDVRNGGEKVRATLEKLLMQEEGLNS
ncbi:hypothetical protein K439DRAFT_1163407 [Ramaria rubella]|nr:hypothetical protein K439DRAFT_1163407 [Ramaria rubella]